MSALADICHKKKKYLPSRQHKHLFITYSVKGGPYSITF